MIERLAYSVEEAAASIGISDRKLRDLIHSEGFPLVRLGNRCLIPVDGLRRWLAEHQGGTVQ